MIDFNAFFKISYGMYIVSSGKAKEGNGFISNSVFQITAEPPQFAVCCNKENFTAGIIKKSGAYSISVLKQEAEKEIVGTFGYKSGRNIKKLKTVSTKKGITGVPMVLNCNY